MEIAHSEVVVETAINTEMVYKFLELCGRTAYKSEDKITFNSAEKFLKGLIKNGHESVLEHFNITVRFICDRGVTHELVRHRLAAYTQESTRYCNYSKTGLRVIAPPAATSEGFRIWMKAMHEDEENYDAMIAAGETPQIARSVLPNSTKTEIVSTMNIRQWRHVLNLRTNKAAHPQIREIMVSLLQEFMDKLPVLFEDVYLQYQQSII